MIVPEGTTTTINPTTQCLAELSSACPHLHRLILDLRSEGNNADIIMESMGKALQKRAHYKRCCGLKALHIHFLPATNGGGGGASPNLSPVLTSGACDALLDLHLTGLSLLQEEDGGNDGGLSSWLSTPRSNHLQSLNLRGTTMIPPCIIKALSHHQSSDGAARSLRSLYLEPIMPSHLLSILSIPRPHLSDLSVVMEEEPSNDKAEVMKQMMDSLRGSSSTDGGLRSLVVRYAMGPEGGVALAKGLAGERTTSGGSTTAIRRLEELGLKEAGIEYAGAVALARALEGGGGSTTTTATTGDINLLQRLDLSWCGIGPSGIKEVAQAMTRGACPNLQHLGEW